MQTQLCISALLLVSHVNILSYVLYGHGICFILIRQCSQIFFYFSCYFLLILIYYSKAFQKQQIHMKTYLNKQVKNSTEPRIVFDICYLKKKANGKYVFVLICCIELPQYFQCRPKENSSSEIFNSSIFCSFPQVCSQLCHKDSHDDNRPFFSFLLFKILPITGTRCFSFAALPCSAFQCGVREAEMGSCVRHG